MRCRTSRVRRHSCRTDRGSPGIDGIIIHLCLVGLFGGSDVEVKARCAAKKPTSMQKKKAFPSTVGFAYRHRRIVCLCSLLAPLGPVTDGRLLWCLCAPPPAYCLSVHVPRQLNVPFLCVLNQTTASCLSQTLEVSSNHPKPIAPPLSHIMSNR